MTYYMPTRVYEDENCIALHAAELSALGTKAMLVTGRSSAKQNGSQKDVADALEAHGIPWVLFDEVEENPSIETVMKARDIAVTEGADFFIGIGGGSPMDAAKAISLMTKNHDKDADYLFAGDKTAQWYPVAAVPTTCGTGSEVTGVSVLTIHAKQTKGSISYRIFPELALLDIQYLAHTPLSILRNTAMDALCHLVESYINSAATDYSRMCALQGLHVWSRNRSFLLHADPEETPAPETLENLLRASTLAGMAIAQTATSLPHGLSYGLTYGLGVPHGHACGQFIAGYLREAAEADRETVLEAAGFADLEDLDSFYNTVCGTVDVPEDLLTRMVSQLAANSAKLKSAPFPVDEDVLWRIARGL